jgi:hypothetical protein
MSWLFSQALVAEYSAGICSDGEPSAPLSVMPTQHKFWRNDKTIEPSRLSRFGLTCAVLTEDRGEAMLRSYLAAFPVKTSASPALATVSTAPAQDCGESSSGWFATFDRTTSTWRTAQRSLLGDSELFSETWPKWGSMRNGASYLRPTPVLRTSASESGSWPTPTASLGTKGGRITPRKGREGSTLIEAVSARQTFTTPMARDWRSGKASAATAAKNTRPLSEQVGGLLNPDWVEWLMGWPIGWTALQPLAMDRFHEWQLQHGAFSAAPALEREAA